MSISRKAALAAVIFVLGTCSMSRAQAGAGVTDASIAKEAATADSLYKAQNVVAALPFYEDLHRQQPESNIWRERLAMCLLAAGGSEAEAAANRERAHKLLLDAKAAGDNSNLLVVLLDKLEAPVAAVQQGPESPGMDAFRRAEKAFSTGDLAGALKGYEDANAADPKLYEAPLFAGDTEFKQGHYTEADHWFAVAVAIAPDRETAYRYWGDNLMKQGDAARAEAAFIDAIVAEPYSRTARVGLKQWADATSAQLASPAVALPARAAVDTKGNTTVTIDPSALGNGTSPATLAYSMGAAVWRGGMFRKTYPTETQYRHSLAEEAQSIRVALSTLGKVPPEKLDATWRTLAQLDEDGMLECWILIDHADQGIAQDYAAYRAAHRELLHQYIAKYDVHPK